MAGLAASSVFSEREWVAPQIRVEVVSDDEGFDRLEPVWDQVLQSAECEHPFLEFIWVRTWWECFGSGSLHILVLWAGSQPIGIAPLMVTRTSVCGLPVRRIGFLYNAHVPRTDFIIARRHEECYQAIWRHLLENRCWDLLQLCQLPDTSPTLDAMAEIAEQDGHRIGLWASGESPFIRLHTTWLEYQTCLAAKHRSNLRNRFKRLGQIGPVALETLTTPQDLGAGLDEGMRIEAAAWKGSEGTAIACLPQLRKFYRLFGERSAARGWLRLNFLRCGDRRVAFDYSLCYRDRLFLLKLGYDPEVAMCSPSSLLLAKVLEKACGSGRERYDLLGQFVDWKRPWAKEAVAHQWLFVFSKGWRGRLAYTAKFRLTPWAKRMLRRA